MLTALSQMPLPCSSSITSSSSASSLGLCLRLFFASPAFSPGCGCNFSSLSSSPLRALCVSPASRSIAVLKRATSSNAFSAMASAFKPEESRRPPAIPLPPPPIQKFKIALCQLLVTADKEKNIAHARKAIEEAADKGAKLVVLPEIWNSPYSNDSFPVYAEEIDAGGDASPSSAMLSEVARSKQITIVGGSIPERFGDRLYNTCCIFGSDGKLKAKHRKIHLFDIDIPGKITFKESKTLTAGETPTIVDTDVGRIGVGICYDIRFQELGMLYGARVQELFHYLGSFIYSSMQQQSHLVYMCPYLPYMERNFTWPNCGSCIFIFCMLSLSSIALLSSH
ncbi:omega-amidase, chloroplastic isoform X2 [Nymphaea colorata]|uniref:omega-amidase, chloroplastic isoform X2 n=1 Tax=Nymphaea colorata TaxID=210225 RepID=UPI00129E06B9|nr:omega-amidase, chloroplastic isoform X2 [Nymphaea colorata]